MRTLFKQLVPCMIRLGLTWRLATGNEPMLPDMLIMEDGLGWTDESIVEGTTYSVIVVDTNPRPSNQFRDQERVRAYNRQSGGGVVSAQFVNPAPPLGPWVKGEPPFFVGHPEGVDKLVRLVFIVDLGSRRYPEAKPTSNQISHLRATCENERETTIIAIVDETCTWTKLPSWVPPPCFFNVVRIYPFNSFNDFSLPPEFREAYMPLGPRNSFPFIDREHVHPAAGRALFFNLQVTAGTSPRRRAVIRIVHQYNQKHPEIPNKSNETETSFVEWQYLLLNSTFTICPGGHNAETFRLWEALEAGSIPIVSKLDYTTPAYFLNNQSCGIGPVSWNTVAASPFVQQVSVASWHDLPALLDDLWQKPDSFINKLQEDCMSWYAEMMGTTYNSLLNFGESSNMYPQLGPVCDTEDTS